MASLKLSSFQFTEIKKVLKLLSKRDRSRLVLVLIINTLLAFLDLMGVALIGVATASLIRGLQSLDAGNQVSRFLELFNLDGLPQKTLLILLLYNIILNSIIFYLYNIIY